MTTIKKKKNKPIASMPKKPGPTPDCPSAAQVGTAIIHPNNIIVIPQPPNFF